jgi:hypothetical protein
MNGARIGVLSLQQGAAQRFSPAGAATTTTQQQAFALIGNTLGTTASTVQSIVNSNNEVEKARIAAATQQAIAELTAQTQRATSVQEAQRYQAQLEALRLVQAQVQANSMTPTMRLALIGGGVLLVGVVAVVALRRPRSNPVRGRGRRRRFVKPRKGSRRAAR